MSTHSKVRTVWNSGQPVLHGEFAALDFGQFDSISCSGGTYAPASVITVGGAGMTLTLIGTSTFAAASGVNVVSSAFVEFQAGGLLECDVGSFASFAGSTAFEATSTTIFAAGSTTSLAGDFDMPASGVLQTDAGSTVLLLGSVTLGPTATLAVGCASTFSAAMTAQSISTTGIFSSGGVSCVGLNASGGASLAAVGISGAATCSGSLAINGGATLTTDMICSGAGRVTKRVTYIVSTGANSSAYGPENSDVVYVAGLTAGVTFTIDDTNAQDGDEMRFVTDDATHFLTINDPVGGTFMSLKNAPGETWSCLVMRILGRWKAISEDNA